TLKQSFSRTRLPTTDRFGGQLDFNTKPTTLNINMSLSWSSWLATLEPQQSALGLLFVVLSLTLAYVSIPGRHDHLPYINRPPKWDFLGQKTKQHFVSNARSLMANAREAFKGKPYRMFTDLGDLIVIPAHHADEMRNERSLDFLEAFVDNFHPNIPGFEGFTFDGRKDQLLHKTINKKITKMLNEITAPLSLEADFATRLILGTSTASTLSQAQKSFDSTLIIFATSPAILFRNADYSENKLQRHDAFLTRPQLMEDVRAEIVAVLRKEGWTKSALFNMKLLDSVIKEAQRLKPTTSATMNRKATSQVKLPGGLVLEKGDRCMADLGSMVDPNVYPDPLEFDGYRFFRMRGDPKMDSKAHLVSTSVSHMGFGHGLHACPGRFFASNEVKVLLCHLLHKYDWKLDSGFEHTIHEFGLSLSSGSTKAFVARRQNVEIDIDAW
ncbi:ent-kaurene oxidase, partial [Colletotrichum lupini]